MASWPAASASSASTTIGASPAAHSPARGERRAHDPDRVLDPGLVQREHVGVALATTTTCPRAPRRPARGEPEELAALVEDVALGVLRYLGCWLSRSARAPKPSTRPRASASGNMIRPRKRSIEPAAPCCDRAASPASQQLARREAAAQRTDAAACPRRSARSRRGRSSDAPPQAAAGEVRRAPRRLVRVPQVRARSSPPCGRAARAAARARSGARRACGSSSSRSSVTP